MSKMNEYIALDEALELLNENNSTMVDLIGLIAMAAGSALYLGIKKYKDNKKKKAKEAEKKRKEEKRKAEQEAKDKYWKSEEGKKRLEELKEEKMNLALN